MKPPQVNVLAGRTFVVSDTRGDIVPSPDEPAGLFHRDMRHLSRWELRLNGQPLEALTGAAVHQDEAVFFLVEASGTVYRNPDLTIVRRRYVSTGMREKLEVTNYSDAARSVELTLLFSADFCDIFEVKDRMQKVGRVFERSEATGATLGYQRGDFHRETTVHAPHAFCTGESLTYQLVLAPGECWVGEVDVVVHAGHDDDQPPAAVRPDRVRSDQWLDEVPRLETSWDDLRRIYRQSLDDLAALRFHPDGMPTAALPAAGLPWFMALFGRDSLITSYQALPFVPDLCRTTLRALAAHQATAMDDFRDAEPGKILHELREGELTYFRQWPQSPYYGSADATPWFLVVLDEYERWTGDTQTVRDLEGAARAALHWIDAYGDSTGDGFVDYRTRNPSKGLANQCWKDSWNSIIHPDGTLAELPRATCEIQGYVYDARRRCARLAREVWGDPELADRLDRQADRLREAFVAAYWMPDEQFYALALDGSGRQVRTLTSNAGHLLFSGIVPDEHVDPVVSRLMDERFFTGWGVRTMADGQRPYNPLSYHNGTVWPHDNSLIVAGLVRYGRRQQAATLAEAMLQAAPHFGNRLPEVLAGTARAVSPLPVPYPTACIPQAWAAGTPLLFLRALLGLAPQGDRLTADPYLPERFGPVELRGIPGRWGRTDVTAPAAG